MNTTYGYHYGGKTSRGDRYGKVKSKPSIPKANLGEGHSNAAQTGNMRFNAEFNRLDNTTKSALNKFTNKPDSQLTSAERDSLYRIQPWFYLQYVRNNYPNKVEFHKDRLKSFVGFRRNIEENGLVPKDSAETKPETQYAEQAVKEQANPEKSAEDKATDAVRNEALGVNKPKSKPAETKVDQPAANPDKVIPEKQAAKDTVDSTEPTQPAWTPLSWREIINRNRYLTPELNPSERFESSPNTLWDFPELAMSRNSSYYLNDAYARKVERDRRREAGRMNLDNINPLTGHSMSPARYNSFSSIMGRNEPKLYGLATAGVLGLGGLGLYGRYKYGDIEQPQTQILSQMEPEPVNETVVPPEPEELTPEVVNESAPSQALSSSEGIELVRAAQDAVNAEAYRRYLDRINQSNSVSSQESPEAVEVSEDLNDAPEAQAVKDAAQSAYGRALKRSKSAPVITEESAGPVVLNAPKQHKTANRTVSQNTAKQAADVSRTVNNSQKPEAALAQSLLRARQESRANRGDAGLQRYRYQSLLNSGLRGMTPDEAIRSGLLTPEQVQVLMRGPY